MVFFLYFYFAGYYTYLFLFSLSGLQGDRFIIIAPPPCHRPTFLVFPCIAMFGPLQPTTSTRAPCRHGIYVQVRCAIGDGRSCMSDRSIRTFSVQCENICTQNNCNAWTVFSVKTVKTVFSVWIIIIKQSRIIYLRAYCDPKLRF